jgi:hypothetical protein
MLRARPCSNPYAIEHWFVIGVFVAPLCNTMVLRKPMLP